MEQKVVTIVGGTGFLGRYVVRLLAKSGWTIRVIARHPEAALHLKTAGDVGQVVVLGGNIADADSLAGKLEGSQAVINLVGILFESGKQDFTRLHAQGAERLAKLAKAAGVQRFIQVSALGVDKATGSSYARTKVLGEKAVLAAFPSATILRPSVMFGPEDNFFNQFAAMACLLPCLPNVGGGKTKFQLVYVGDVARAVQLCLNMPETQGRIFELGGPQVFTFREILEYVLHTVERERMLLPLPFALAPLAAFGAETFYMLNPFKGAGGPVLTRDQIKLLHYDNVTSQSASGFAQLGLTPVAVDMIVPGYLARFNAQPTIRAGMEKIT